MNKKTLLVFAISPFLMLTSCLRGNDSSHIYSNDSVSEEIPDSSDTESNVESSSSENKSKDRIAYKSSFSSDGRINGDETGKVESASKSFAVEVMEKGTVILTNKNNTLPLQEGAKISLLGSASKNISYHSTRRHANKNDDELISLDKAFKNANFKINQELFDSYVEKNTYVTYFNDAAFEDYTNEEKELISQYGDVAVITIARYVGEDTDLPHSFWNDESNFLDLLPGEINILKSAKRLKDDGKIGKIVVLLNSSAFMTCPWLDHEDYGIDASVWFSNPGYYGLTGVVNVLRGKDNNGGVLSPSGKLPSTIATSIKSAPSYLNAYNSQSNVFKEGFYTGYRYYETRYEDCVLNQGNADSNVGSSIENSVVWDYSKEIVFPFGYGLSYTTFQQEITNYKINGKTLNFTIDVLNTGSREGSSVVQLYVQKPYTNLDKKYNINRPSIELIDFGRTDNIKPGEKKSVSLSVDISDLKTYDSFSNKSYVLSGGDYYFAIGDNVHDALNNILYKKYGQNGLKNIDGTTFNPNYNVSKCVGKICLDEDLNTYKVSTYTNYPIQNQFDDAEYNYVASKNGKESIVYLNREDWNGTWPTTTTIMPASNEDLNMARLYSKKENVSYANGEGTNYSKLDNENPIYFEDMYSVPLNGTVESGRFKGLNGEKVWDDFIKQMNIDDLATTISDGYGISSAKTIQSPGFLISSGTEGFCNRHIYSNNKWATSFPSGCVYTATFDENIFKNYGSLLGEEAIFSGISMVELYGFSMPRDQLRSSNNQNASEDPVLTSKLASAITVELQKKGVVGLIGPTGILTQETGRQRVSIWCNEQVIREYYLRPFEGSLAKGKGLGALTAYNRIGSIYTACHERLMQNIIRNEWGFEGFFMNEVLLGSNTDLYSNGPAMVSNGNNAFMLDSNRGKQLKDYIVQNDDGYLFSKIQESSKRILFALAHTWNINRYYIENESVESTGSGFNNLESSFAQQFKGEETSSVMKLEGRYAEGWQGDYSEATGKIILYKDGSFFAKLKDTSFIGYWYKNKNENSAFDSNMIHFVSDKDKYQYMVAQNLWGGKYGIVASLNMGWGYRTMLLTN